MKNPAAATRHYYARTEKAIADKWLGPEVLRVSRFHTLRRQKRRPGKGASEITGTILALALAALALMLFLLSGCAVQQPPPSPLPAAAVEAPAPPAPEPIAWQPALDLSPPAPRPPEYKDLYSTTTATLIFKPDHRYTLVCPMTEPLTLRLLPGEIYQDIIAGDSVFWMFQSLVSSVAGEPVAVIAIRRGPEAPATVAHIVTDRNIYQLRLLPSGRGENRSLRMISFYDPTAILRKEERLLAAAERRKQKAAEPRYPSLNFETIRTYQVRGDAVSWSPIRVTGDHAHTLIELPANTGTEQPTLSVMRGDVEQRLNYRTIPGQNGKGPVIIADEALSEAKLLGQGGEVFITREN